MIISRKVDYALRSLIYLAERQNGSRISSAELGGELKIPMVFLAKILQTLARHKLVKTFRGKEGGILLQKRRATLLEVIKAFESRPFLNQCLMDGYPCSLKNKCPLHQTLQGLEKDLYSRLGQITIAGLAKNKGG